MGRAWPRHRHRGRPLNSVVRTHPKLERPSQVGRAVFLLWASLIVSVVDALLSIEPLAEFDTEFRLIMAVIFVVTFGTCACLIYLSGKRRNWARWGLLLLTVSGWAVYAIWPSDFAGEPWWSWLGTGATAILDTVALILLFTGAGAHWYSPRKGV